MFNTYIRSMSKVIAAVPLAAATFALIVDFGLVQPSSAQDDEVAFQSIWLAAGLPIRIRVDALDVPAKEAGITEEMLEETVELGLRRNKIPVPGDLLDADCRAAIDAISPGETIAPQQCAIPLEEFMGVILGPVLLISVSVLGIEVNKRPVGYTYRVHLELSTFVELNPEDRLNKVARVFGGREVVGAILWRDWKIGISGNDDELQKAVRSFLSERPDTLSFDYRRALADYEREKRWLSTIK